MNDTNLRHLTQFATILGGILLTFGLLMHFEVFSKNLEYKEKRVTSLSLMGVGGLFVVVGFFCAVCIPIRRYRSRPQLFMGDELSPRLSSMAASRSNTMSNSYRPAATISAQAAQNGSSPISVLTI